jgi:hypothetical protein
VLLLGCRGFTPQQPDQGAAGDRRVERAPEPDGFASGPGPHGALPTGYCCSSDLECRQRRCAELGGVRLCQDHCDAEETCNARLPGYSCRKNDAGIGLCAPVGAPSCTPAAAFPRGRKSTGQCCDPRMSGLTGQECEGNHCVSVHDTANPWVCTNACSAAKDCPIGYACMVASYYRLCFPSAKTYGCSP